MIALKLREYRKINKMTQDEVAGHLKIARVTYSRYESGEHEMTYDSLAILASLYSVSIDSLLGRTDSDILSKTEMAIINKLRDLDERGQKTITALVDYEHNNSKNSLNTNKQMCVRKTPCKPCNIKA